MSGVERGPEERRLRSDVVPGRRCVLILDDEENILRALARLLRDQPYDVITATSAEQAFGILKSRHVDVVISDQRMPGTTGTEFLRDVRKDWPETTRMILSGYTEVNSIVAAVNEGEIYKFLIKPWDDAEIVLRISEAVQQCELQDESRRNAVQTGRRQQQLADLHQELSSASAVDGVISDAGLLDEIAAGALKIDSEGRIASANSYAKELFEQTRGIVGSLACEALPEALGAALAEPSIETEASGCVVVAGRPLQWRFRRLAQDGEEQAVLTVWKSCEYA